MFQILVILVTFKNMLTQRSDYKIQTNEDRQDTKQALNTHKWSDQIINA
jgi:hypothetical protein